MRLGEVEALALIPPGFFFFLFLSLPPRVAAQKAGVHLPVDWVFVPRVTFWGLETASSVLAQKTAPGENCFLYFQLFIWGMFILEMLLEVRYTREPCACSLTPGPSEGVVCAKLLQSCPFPTLWTATLQAPLSMGFSRQGYWSGLPCPPPGDVPNPGVEPTSPVTPALQVDSLPLSLQGSPAN